MKIVNVHMKKIYTKKGDEGMTCVCGDGGSVPKDSPMICALGEIDELNSFIGLAVNFDDGGVEVGFGEILKGVQKDLYRIGAEISVAGGASAIGALDVGRLEKFIDKYSADFSEFVDPGHGGKFSAILHVCRTVCRRTERSVCGIGSEAGGRSSGGVEVSPFVLQYLNRLSDLLFVMAEW